MSQEQDHRILNGVLLAAICGTAIVAAHTNSFQPSFIAEGNQRNNSGVPIWIQVDRSAKLSRAKRLAIYNGQGVMKIVCGVAHPVKQVDKDQSFWFFYNYQGQFTPTTIPIYWWSFWNTTAFVSTARQMRKDMKATLQRDNTRLWLYDAIETGMELLDGSKRGAVCLLRGICEISQLPFEHSNIFSEILNVALIPTVENVAQKYLNARDTGRAGADCMKTYSECSERAWNWLAHITKLNF